MLNVKCFCAFVMPLIDLSETDTVDAVVCSADATCDGVLLFDTQNDLAGRSALPTLDPLPPGMGELFKLFNAELITSSPLKSPDSPLGSTGGDVPPL
jgi:hypothetical protein